MDGINTRRKMKGKSRIEEQSVRGGDKVACWDSGHCIFNRANCSAVKGWRGSERRDQSDPRPRQVQLPNLVSISPSSIARMVTME